MSGLPRLRVRYEEDGGRVCATRRSARRRRGAPAAEATRMHHYVKATVRVHEYPDGRLAIFDGRAAFELDATLIDASRTA